MQIRELAVPGAWEFTPRQFGDDRGAFDEAIADASLCLAPLAVAVVPDEK